MWFRAGIVLGLVCSASAQAADDDFVLRCEVFYKGGRTTTATYSVHPGAQVVDKQRAEITSANIGWYTASGVRMLVNRFTGQIVVLAPYQNRRDRFVEAARGSCQKHEQRLF